MKLSSFSILASFGLAALQASASPIRVVMISSSNMPPPAKVEINHFRFGLAAAEADAPLPAAIASSSNLVITHGPMHASERERKHTAGCSSSLRASNWLRQKLGLPLIEPHYRLTSTTPAHGHHHHDTGVHNASTAKYTEFVHSGPVAPHHKWHRPHSFSGRLQKALMMLGPWEGRAVAFVLGCGIGTLLRMLYVLVVVGYRSSAHNSDEEEVDILFEEVEVVPAPPAYPADEKVAIPAEDKQDLTAN